MTLQGHISEHIGMMAEIQAQQEVIASLPPEAQMKMQQDPMMQQQLQSQIDDLAAVKIGELTEQYAQAVSPADNTDPLVAIRQQELALRGAEIQEKSRQFEEKQGLEREKERNDVLLAQQRLDLQEEANEERIRGADNRVQTQRDIAAANLANRRQ